MHGYIYETYEIFNEKSLQPNNCNIHITQNSFNQFVKKCTILDDYNNIIYITIKIKFHTYICYQTSRFAQ